MVPNAPPQTPQPPACVCESNFTMSALGQTQTFAPQEVVSALPQKQTCAVHRCMSALGQKRTFRNSFDHLIGDSKTYQFANKTGKAAFAKTCWVATPNIHCRIRLCV